MEISRNKYDLTLSQKKYVIKLLKETSLTGSKPINTIIDPNTKFGGLITGSLVNKGRYQRFMGKLINLDHKRTNIAFVISILK